MSVDPETLEGSVTPDDLRIVAEQCGVRVFVRERGGRCCYVNESACRSLGYTRDELMAMRPWDFIVDAEPEGLLDFWDLIPCGGELSKTCFHRRKDGSVFPVQARVARHVVGGRERIIAFVQDLEPRPSRSVGVVLEDLAREPREARGAARGLAYEFARANGMLKQTLDAMAGVVAANDLLELVLASIASLLGSRHVALWLFEPDSRDFRLYLAHEDSTGVAAGEADSPSAQQPERLDAAILRVRSEGTKCGPVLVEIADHPDLTVEQRDYLMRSGARWLLTMPMLIGATVLGEVTAGIGMDATPTTESFLLATTLVQQATLVVQMARLGREAERVAVAEERNRLARELHDTMAQGFAGILMQLNACQGFLPGQPDLAVGHLDLAREQARDALVEARRSVAALRPRVLVAGDLPAALRDLARDLGRSSAMIWEFELSGTPRSLPPEAEDGLLRIAQEAAHNAIKHAGSTSARITLAFGPGVVRLTVSDEGTGFDPSVTSGPGQGLIGMNERAVRLGGELAITGGSARGTLVTVTIPDPPTRDDDR